MPYTARDRVHVALGEIDSATGHLRNAARHLDHILIDGGLSSEQTERLILLSDQIVATSDAARGFGTDLTDMDTGLRGARRSEDEASA